MAKVIKRIFTFTSLICVLLSHQILLAAETYEWNDFKIKLPLPKNWLSKKPKSNAKDPLVFLDIDDPKPRIIARVYHPHLVANLQNLSDFKEGFLKSKNKWMKENEATLAEGLKFNYLEENQSFLYEYMFSTSYGKFLEIGLIAKCKKPIALKLMIPEARIEKAKSMGILTYMRKHQLCP